MKFKSYKKKKINYYFSFIIFILLLSISLSLVIIHNYSLKVDKIMKPIAVARVRKYVTELINSSMKEVNFNSNLINIEKNNDVIEMINYNTEEVTKILNEITFNIQDKLDNNYIIDYVSSGVIFNSSLLNNIGPKIPIKMKMIGSIISNIETEVKPYGINNAYVEMRVYLEVNGLVVLPFTSEEVKVSNVIPVKVFIISGKVPYSYMSTYK